MRVAWFPIQTDRLTRRRHDTTPSFLQHSFRESNPYGPLPKKARLSDAVHQFTTISTKLSNGAYSTLEGLRQDAERVSSDLVTSTREKAKEKDGQNTGRLSVEDLKQIQRVQAFEKAIKDLVDQESKYEQVQGKVAVKKEQDKGDAINGHVQDVKPGAANKARSVLTLFGNAPTPKQLFSSMQSPAVPQEDAMIKTELPVEEMSLPNGLTATKVLPAPGDSSKKGPTFEEAFPPPSTLPALHPPKSHKRSSTRDSTLTWEFKDPMSSRNRKGGFTVQNLTVGDWLHYGGVDAREDTASPREKRKQRDRALSGGEGSQQPPPSQESLEDALVKEEEALFRRAYSSFAPSFDNTKALVPEETRNVVWWQKAGSKRFEETFALDPALVDERSGDLAVPLDAFQGDWRKEEDFGKVVEELETLDEEMENLKSVVDRTDVDQVLHEISELLETLASHQRIRNATLSSSTLASRTPMSPAPTLASRIGRPDSPAEDEVSTYHALRRELAYLVLRLPPYAVTKLDGDRLSELGVSKLITFENRDTRGTMEEDQVARLAKYNAMTAAAGLSTLNRTGSSGSQHYSSTNQRTPAIGQAANTRYGQSTQYGARTPGTQPQFQRSTSSQQSHGTPSATAPRPGYGQYVRPGGTQLGGQQYYRPPQQTPGGYAGYNQQQQYSQSTPQPPPQRPGYPPSSAAQPLPQYQPRSHAPAANAVAYQSQSNGPPQPQQPQQPQSPFARSASPIKPAGAVQRPSSGRATPASGYASQLHTPVNGYASRPPQPIAQAPPRPTSTTPQPVVGQGPLQGPVGGRTTNGGGEGDGEG